MSSIETEFLAFIDSIYFINLEWESYLKNQPNILTEKLKSRFLTMSLDLRKIRSAENLESTEKIQTFQTSRSSYKNTANCILFI